ncbi:MAG: phosphatidylglycerol lysyltransferase domain-containing protein [Treponema sp.]|jgi:hypothetical protein|nr:phosphatidylglycerol lysyltransferase domain-containing protein [Treponema sp.]
MTEQQHKAYEYFRNQGFLPVNKESYPVFKSYDGKDSRLFETTAMISTVWAFAYQTIYKIIYGYLCSLWFNKDGSIYCIVQEPDATVASLQELVDTLYELYHAADLPALQLWTIEERFLKAYQNIQGYAIKADYSDDWSEYAYRPQHILEIPGKINANKRNCLNKFIAAPNVSVLPITKENIHICFELEDVWCSKQDCQLCASFSGCEKKALEDMVDMFDDRICNGIFGCVDNIPVAYAIWEKRNEKIAILYFAKANLTDFNVYLYYILVKLYLSEVEYINIGHDMGKAGLRMFKKRLGSHERWKKYLCTFTKSSE